MIYSLFLGIGFVLLVMKYALWAGNMIEWFNNLLGGKVIKIGKSGIKKKPCEKLKFNFDVYAYDAYFLKIFIAVISELIEV